MTEKNIYITLNLTCTSVYRCLCMYVCVIQLQYLHLSAIYLLQQLISLYWSKAAVDCLLLLPSVRRKGDVDADIDSE